MNNQLNDFLVDDYKKWGSRPYLHEFCDGGFKTETFGGYIEDINYLASYLLSKGYKGKSIGIYSPNSIPWCIFDIAVMNYVGISVGLSKEWTSDNLVYAIDKCDIVCLFYGKVLEDKVNAVKDRFPGTEFVCIEDEWDNCIARGKELTEELFSLEPQDPDVPAKIVFTSGTTSFPKAVMLSINNVFSGYKSLGRRVQIEPEDICYLFLPLNHTYGSIYNFIYSLVYGYEIYLARDTSKMAQEIMTIRPTVFSAVPLVYMKFYEGARAMGISLKQILGGRMKYTFCGGARLAPEIRDQYMAEGFYLMNAYALSETSSGFSIDYPGDEILDSVGTLFEDVDACVKDPDEDGWGELAIKGDNIFKGYYKDDEATKAVFSDDGYFLTGDIGKIENNHVYVRGRKDTRITLINGENISTSLISERVKSLSDKVVHVKVYIQNEYLTCDIYIESDALDLDWDALIEDLNGRVPKYERIMRYNIRDKRELLK
ncbi:Long-chain acyl-CoA synthetase (AMP-forming) [Ruminococcaceae bacterium YRB3002]|nr:Long-chain acyl-CoA synthetase (AMP-forming) [Ruminococcaceae bacterium YRB3002]